MTPLPEVSFYPLQQSEPEALLQFACRLTEKACQLGHRVHLLVPDQDSALRLDDLLWQYRAESFIPHELLGENPGGDDARSPVTIGTPTQLPAAPELLINLTDSLWSWRDRFRDIREIVSADPQGRERGRLRYKEYRARGYPVETLKV